MLIAHAPAGFLAIWATEKIWNKVKFDRLRRIVLYSVGILFSIFPDFDAFYHYFFSAESSHRTYITHGISLYILIFLIFYIAGWILKKEFLKSLGLVILIGSFTHLLLDSIASGVSWLVPFSPWMISLRSFDFIKDSWIGNNAFLVNYSLELLIIIFFLGVLLFSNAVWSKEKSVNSFKQKMWYINYIIFGILILTFGIVGLAYINAHIYNGDSYDMCFEDKDNDAIINSKDFDINNDGELNINDSDANANNILNREEIVDAGKSMIGNWYDPTEAGTGELLTRWGFFVNYDVVRKSYEQAGIYLGEEFRIDYQNNSDDYFLNPREAMFYRKGENLYAFCNHKDGFFSNAEALMPGDIVFYDNGLVGLVSETDREKKVIVAKIGEEINEYILEDIGEVEKFCKIIE